MSGNIKASKAVQKLVEIAMVEHKRGTFSHFLTTTPLKLVSSDKKEGTIFTYTVPDTLCRTFKGNPRPQVGTATLLALFDELSTYGLMLNDKVPRGGVSVQLSTETVKHCYAGDEVIVKTKSDKVGRAIGFCTMELLTPDGQLLARGKHVKYLPLGRMWDILASPMMLPISLWLFMFFTKTFPETALGKWYYGNQAKKMKKKGGDTGNHSDDDDVSDIVMKSMAGSKRSDVSTDPYVSERFNSAGGAFRAVEIVKLPAGDSRVDSSVLVTNSADKPHAQHFELKVKPHLTNLLRKMHGGAVATAIEEACMQSRYPEGETGNFHVNSLDIRYLSPMKGDLIITVIQDRHAPSLSSPLSGGGVFATSDSGSSDSSSSSNGSKTKQAKAAAEEDAALPSSCFGTISNEKGGQICAQFTCHWSTAKE